MPTARRILAIVIAAYLLLVFYDRFVLIELLFRRIGVPLLLAILETAALIGTGFAARGLFARRWHPEDLDLARELVIGYPIFGTLCFLAGTLNVSAWSMGALLILGGAAGAYALVRRFETRPPVRGAGIDPISLVVIAVVFLFGFVAAQAPPSSLDELAYHLAVPWNWVKEGRAIDLPLISHSYFPLGIESADLPLLAMLGRLGGGIASHFMHLGAAMATTALLLRLGRGNALATAAVVATPALALTAGWSLVEFPLLGICAALVLDEDDVAPAIAAGLLTKYTFIPFALIVLLVGRASARLAGLKAGLPGILFGSVFFIRNVLLTGNPIAPFFSADAPHVAGFRHPYLSDYIFSGSFIDESLGASMLVACALGTGVLTWALIGAGILLFLLAPSSRLLIPYFAVPAARSLQPGRILRVVLLAAIAGQLFLIGYFVDRSQVFSLMTGKASDEEFLTSARPSYRTIAALDALLPASSCTLVVGLNETFWFERRARGGGNFDGPRLSRYLEAPAAEALYARLKRDGITHVAVFAPTTPPTADAKRLEERETALTPGAQRTLALMLDHFVRSVTSRERATIFTLN